MSDLRTRVESRRWAEESYEAASDKPAFVERCMELGGRMPKPVKRLQIIPMDDKECRAFENSRLSFGKYRDVEIRIVPLDYLAWFADLPEQEIKPQIKRYLASKRIQEEIKAEDGDDC